MKKRNLDCGLEKTKEIWGEKRTDLIDDLGELGELILAVAFGDVYQDDTLSTRERELITLSILIDKGNCDLQLKNHFKGALNVGLREDELRSLIIQAALYSGFPNAINALNILKEVLKQS